MTKDVASGCVLVVDDEQNIREIVSVALSSVVEKVIVADSASKAMEILREENVDVVVSDIRMPGLDGLAFLRQVKQEQPKISFLMMTAHGSLETAVKALRYGASDFLTKPFENAELRDIVKRLLAVTSSFAKSSSYPVEQMADGGFAGVIGQSSTFIAALEKSRKAANTDSTVLLLGESGSGKEVVARFIHDSSSRQERPFVPVNCGAIPENLIESELFGHEKGAFTGAISSKPGRFLLAGGGTVFLDEIGDLPLSMQVKLLRVLQERVVDPIGGRGPVRVDFRLIAATNKNLREEVRAGRFREDLYFRLNIIPIEMPPLRERGGDVLLLARHFLKHFNRHYGTAHALTQESERKLLAYAWPGNVRELANAVERAVVLAAGPELQFQLDGMETAMRGLIERKQSAEKDEIFRALELNRWNKTKTAEHLGISRRGLLYKIKEYGIR
ncbi:MAG TPA: hypothetical protein DCQ83_00490 [Fibrobacteres bacterium]|jgi:DNA-binding NtrC family response regulator|nr:hypothetical protein [Fibrobacterota bacterium]